MTLREFLIRSSKFVTKKHNQSFLWLLEATLKLSRSQVLLQHDRVVTAGEQKRIKNAWKRFQEGEPLQYIVKSAPFWGFEFLVNRKVLIPRPETEILVEKALEVLKRIECPTVLDIGTGSGAIAVTIQVEKKQADVYATDISRAALSVAKKNASLMRAEKIHFQKADLIPEIWKKKKWDLIISNPPYLSFRKDYIAPRVLQWEPRGALEPTATQKGSSRSDRAFWTAEKILFLCEKIRPRYTLLELSPRVANKLERVWKKNPAILELDRFADLVGRKRFLFIAWKCDG